MDPGELDTMVWYRVTRYPQVFTGLMVYQRAPGFWGFTTIEREVDDTLNIREAGVKDKRKESQHISFSSGKKQRTSTSQGFQGQDRSYQGQGQGQGQSS